MAVNFEFCKPNCPDRKPGCQDHCNFHAERKKLWAERKAMIGTDRDTRQYVAFQKAKNFDKAVKRRRKFAGCNWRRYGK